MVKRQDFDSNASIVVGQDKTAAIRDMPAHGISQSLESGDTVGKFHTKPCKMKPTIAPTKQQEIMELSTKPTRGSLTC